MSVKKITLTDDMLKLISCIRFKEAPKIRENDDREHLSLEIDYGSLYGGSFLLEDVSYILGCYDKHIEGTEENALGPEFENDLSDYMYNTHLYILENLGDIEELVHWFSNKGGLYAGTYEYDESCGMWKLRFDNDD